LQRRRLRGIFMMSRSPLLGQGGDYASNKHFRAKYINLSGPLRKEDSADCPPRDGNSRWSEAIGRGSLTLPCLLLLFFASTLGAQTPRLSLVPFASGFTQPVFLTSAKDHSERTFIVEQVGRIRVTQPGATTSTVFLDITSKVLFGDERGLLGLTFHPQFAANGRYYVNYTQKPDGSTVVAEYP